MGTNKVFGAFGECLAAEYLSENGYKVLERNFCCRFGEIDIIAAHEETIVFIEVKTRSSEKFGMPSEAVSLTKQNRMVKTALYYMQKNKLLDYMCRFDVLEIIVDEDNIKRINLIKDAFQYSGKHGY
ncbi:MAG: YraN family protein [Gracilibacteraceae bacterium]|jgi:putative endonuclease|nr:YraN family protein [Gracilibacteraceae bacterium]